MDMDNSANVENDLYDLLRLEYGCLIAKVTTQMLK